MCSQNPNSYSQILKLTKLRDGIHLMSYYVFNTYNQEIFLFCTVITRFSKAHVNIINKIHGTESIFKTLSLLKGYLFLN